LKFYSSYIINLSSKFRNCYLFKILLTLSIVVISCENKLPVIPKSDLLTLPSLTGKDVQTILNDSGRVQLIMSAPLIEQYDKANPTYSEFRSGIKVDVYNGKVNPEAKVTAKYGKCTSNNLWELRDSVVVINEKNEKLETELLYWNQEKDRIYTDRFVKLTSEDQVTQGIGFESDSHLINRKILQVTATIDLKNEE
jgi:LPS export ABC transporter protein LptC